MNPGRACFSAVAVALVFASGASAQDESNELRAVEQKRASALVNADMDLARRVIADDFQLINPMGGVLSKEEYLALVSSGDIDYLEWTPERIDVKEYGNAAVIRYRATINIVMKGAPNAPSGRIWFTDLYEKRNGEWQIVWSQGTQAK